MRFNGIVLVASAAGSGPASFAAESVMSLLLFASGENIGRRCQEQAWSAKDSR